MRRARVLIGLLLVGAVVAVVAVAASSDSPAGHLVVDADQARFIHKGSEVRVAGRIVGEVTSAEPTRDGRARVALQIDDDRVWPLRAGTRAVLRWGSTIAYTHRRVDLMPPAHGGAPLPDGAVIPADDVTTGVEVDQLLSTFDA